MFTNNHTTNTTDTINTATDSGERSGIAGMLRTRWAAIGAAVAVSVGGGGIGLVHATIDSGERSVLSVLDEPCRLMDSRVPTQVGPRNTPIGADEVYTLDAHGENGECDLSEGATALSLNVTAVEATQQTNLRFFGGTGPVPNAANMNPGPGQPPAPNAVTVDVDGDGQFSVFNKFGSVHVIIDVIGVYEDHNHDDRYVARDTVRWAVVQPNGDIARSSDNFGFVFEDLSTATEGDYVIGFSDDVGDCAFQATVGRRNTAIVNGFAQVATWDRGDLDGIRVITRDQDGVRTSGLGFHVLVTC